MRSQKGISIADFMRKPENSVERANDNHESHITISLISMQNLLERYAESSNSSHLSIESDKQPVSVDVDETSTVQEHRDTRKQPPNTFKPLVQISKFFTPVQKQVPASSEQLPFSHSRKAPEARGR